MRIRTALSVISVATASPLPLRKYLSRSNRRVKFAPGVQSPAISILAPKGGKRCSPGSPQALAASGSSKARRCSS